MSETVKASPSKNFFVTMMTRDIELKDAILDLLDNCVDGLLRELRKKDPSIESGQNPYNGYWAKITASPTGFSIEDNCGGISKEIAKNSAFRLGRSDEEKDKDKDIPTVGMYGIGMKRAIFKMGRHAIVRSQHKGEPYFVEIPETWLTEDENWDLALNLTDKPSKEDGTFIVVDSLYPNIATQFNTNEDNFLSDLYLEIKNLFALIIKKGFKVELNKQVVEAAELDLLIPSDFSSSKGIKPYLYKAKIKNVNVELIVGFYAELPSDEEITNELQTPRKTDNAGWTIICNDRVVLYRDKTAVTGWGVRDVPKYHTQFIAVAGVVRFSSNTPYELPLNTTKRGIDNSSELYSQTKNKMMEGMKLFTDFTNHWKGREEETVHEFRGLTSKDAVEAIREIPAQMWHPIKDSSDGELRIKPVLPRPEKSDLRARIVFLRLKTEIEAVSNYLYGESIKENSKIGNDCFQKVFDEARGLE